MAAVLGEEQEGVGGGDDEKLAGVVGVGQGDVDGADTGQGVRRGRGDLGGAGRCGAAADRDGGAVGGYVPGGNLVRGFGDGGEDEVDGGGVRVEGQTRRRGRTGGGELGPS